MKTRTVWIVWLALAIGGCQDRGATDGANGQPAVEPASTVGADATAESPDNSAEEPDRNMPRLGVPRGLISRTDAATPGYVLYNQLVSDTTYLLDLDGQVVHTWVNEQGAGSGYLLDDGTLLRTVADPDAPVFGGGGQGGFIQKAAWDGEVLWEFHYANENYRLHHDIALKPNGNILAIAWEAKTVDESIVEGRDPANIPVAGLWPDRIIELRPIGSDDAEIVWEWHMWDHVVQDFDETKDNYGVVADHPELLDINIGDIPEPITEEEFEAQRQFPNQTVENRGSDIYHVNAINYNAELDLIAISSPNLNEIFVIDNSTSREEAAGHSGGRWGKGGDFLYRWGNPANYGRGDESDQRLGGQHDVSWVTGDTLQDHRLLVFNNNVPGTEPLQSAVIELALPLTEDGFELEEDATFGPGEPVWQYMTDDPMDFFSGFISGAQRLANGNTFITEGAAGRVFEVDRDGNKLWEFMEPFSGTLRPAVGPFVHGIFRATHLPPDHAALAGKTLQPIDPQPPFYEPPPPRDIGRLGADRWLISRTDAATPGYVFYNPLLSDTTYLVDLDGQVVHTWTSELGTSGGIYLQDDGTLIRAGVDADAPVFGGGGQGGWFQKLGWDGEVLWEFHFANEDYRTHHDFALKPNGNILAIAWEARSVDESIAAGRDPANIPVAGMWPDWIVELRPIGSNDAEIVWQWHLWDHVIQDFDETRDNYGVVADHPELLDINVGDIPDEPMTQEELDQMRANGNAVSNATLDNRGSDLYHVNAINYNAELELIAISVPGIHEIYVIDNSTTTEEAAGHSGGRWGKGGDLLYRWGNPANYGRGVDDDRRLGGQHDVSWVTGDSPQDVRLLVYNNSVPGAEPGQSAVIELALPLTEAEFELEENAAFGPAEAVWQYMTDDPMDFFSPFISGAQRLANGNTLVTEGAAGRFFEVDRDGNVLWNYMDPFSGDMRNADGTQPQPVGPLVYATFRSTHVAADHPGLADRELRPLNPQPPVYQPPAN